jgi:predicted aminopeptidase
MRLARRHLLPALLTLTALSGTLGCQLGYYLHSGYYQTKLISSRIRIQEALESPKLNEEQKRKLRLVQEVKAFAESKLGLKPSRNYTGFVELNDPYVTYIVQVAYARELKPYLWKFPFVGEVPYKGYFKKSLAEEEAASFPKDQFDTYVRGVSAYSTLGWFQDSVLSSMLRYEDYELAEVIIHETVHTTLFIKSAAEFNERMATFLGQEGMKLFYREKGEAGADALRKAENDSHDQKLFSEFITREIQDLRKWYADNKDKFTPEAKAARLAQIKTRFLTELKPRFKGVGYRDFERHELNNALILAYQTYEYSLADFEKLHHHFGDDFQKTLNYLKGFADSPKPAQALKDFVAGFSPEAR